MKYAQAVVIACLGSAVVSSAMSTNGGDTSELVARGKSGAARRRTKAAKGSTGGTNPGARTSSPGIAKAERYGQVAGKVIGHLGLMASTATGATTSPPVDDQAQALTRRSPLKRPKFSQSRPSGSSSSNKHSSSSNTRAKIKAGGTALVKSAGGGAGIAGAIGSTIALTQQLQQDQQPAEQQMSRRDIDEALAQRDLGDYYLALRNNHGEHGKDGRGRNKRKGKGEGKGRGREGRGGGRKKGRGGGGGGTGGQTGGTSPKLSTSDSTGAGGEATSVPPADTPPTGAEATEAPLAGRDFDEQLALRDLEDMLLATRDYDENLFVRDLEDRLYSRGYDDELFARDYDDELFARELAARGIVSKFKSWRASRNQKKAEKYQAKADKASQKAASYGAGAAAGAGAPPAAPPAPPAELAARDLENYAFIARDYDEEIFARDLEEELFARDFEILDARELNDLD